MGLEFKLFSMLTRGGPGQASQKVPSLSYGGRILGGRPAKKVIKSQMLLNGEFTRSKHTSHFP